MTPLPDAQAPRWDVPNLAVHALWRGGSRRCSRAGAPGRPLSGWWRWGLVSRPLGLACGFAYRGYSVHHFNHHKYNDGPGD